ncbi:MAG: NAD(P)H-dependent glycerol-3-phosphate dehydrogenase [Candidatus Latescibacterota bacterium]
MNIAVLGAGNWGTTAALLLHRNGHRVKLWEFNETLAAQMTEHRENRLYLPGFPLPQDILVTHVLSDAVKDSDAVVFVVPSAHMRQTACSLKDTGALSRDAILVSLSKGLEHESLLTMTGVIGDVIGGHPLVAMSGPCIASEVARGLPTTIVSASYDQQAARTIQDVFMSPSFRVYTSNDPLGIQLGGALKNIIAIAAGINDGLGFGTNSKSALITRGIVEMRRFGKILDARPETFNGLSGIGDLITTCVSGYSRNRRLGEELAKGKVLQEVLGEMVMVAEGVPTAKTVYEFSRTNGVDMPITAKVYGVLFEGLSPRTAVTELMMRDRKPEYHSS